MNKFFIRKRAFDWTGYGTAAAGTGTLAALVAALASKKNRLRNALIWGGIGAGTGAAGKYGYDKLMNYLNNKNLADSTEDPFDSNKENQPMSEEQLLAEQQNPGITADDLQFVGPYLMPNK